MCSRISRASQPSVAPPSASPTAAPASAATARSTTPFPFTRSLSSRPTGGRPEGRPREGHSLPADRVPPVDELLRQLRQVDLVREVLPERRRRHFRLPAGVRAERDPVRLLEGRHRGDRVLPAAVVLRV